MTEYVPCDRVGYTTACPECGSSDIRRRELTQPFKIIHGDRDDEFVCSDCKVSFDEFVERPSGNYAVDWGSLIDVGGGDIDG